MKQIVPDFYRQFSCKAGDCRHTCCSTGWEIDIDDKTAAAYMAVPGAMGTALRQAMVKNEEGIWQFHLVEGNCPFLQPDGLCHLVLTLGEDALCDICALHPRFYEEIDTAAEPVELGGVGLCCEKSCELLLASQTPLTFTDGAAKPMPFAELLIYLHIEMTGAQQQYQPITDMAYLQFVLECMEQTEPIHDAWTRKLQDLQAHLPTVFQSMKTMIQDGLPYQWQRIYQYILYRQLERCEDVPCRVLADYAHLNTTFIWLSCIQTGSLAESLREWSEQIEYDTDNVDILFELLV